MGFPFRVYSSVQVSVFGRYIRLFCEYVGHSSVCSSVRMSFFGRYIWLFFEYIGLFCEYAGVSFVNMQVSFVPNPIYLYPCIMSVSSRVNNSSVCSTVQMSFFGRYIWLFCDYTGLFCTKSYLSIRVSQVFFLEFMNLEVSLFDYFFLPFLHQCMNFEVSLCSLLFF